MYDDANFFWRICFNIAKKFPDELKVLEVSDFSINFLKSNGSLLFCVDTSYFSMQPEIFINLLDKLSQCPGSTIVFEVELLAIK